MTITSKQLASLHYCQHPLHSNVNVFKDNFIQLTTLKLALL